jgi:deferrochelatase/peroxidase EfeB
VTSLQQALEETQSNTLVGVAGHLPVGHIFLLRVPPAARIAAGNWLGNLEVRSDAEYVKAHEAVEINVAFTYAGLEALGVPRPILERLPNAFMQGMSARSGQFLDDRGENAEGNWEPHWRGSPPPVHILVALYAQDSEALMMGVEALRPATTPASSSAAMGPQIQILDEQPVGFPEVEGNRKPLREHFGFQDGVGEPDIEGLYDAIRELRGEAADPNRRARALGVYDRALRKWRGLKPGEIVFGLENEGGGVVPQPRETDRERKAEFDQYRAFMAHGTFMAYRKLHQRVRVFRNYLARVSHSSRLPPDHVGAKLVGRWPDSTPLMPLRGDLEAGQRQALNSFTYDEDPEGRTVPLGAHIRRANPRDGLPGDSTGVKRRRMLRRGMPYGDYLPTEAALDTGFPDDDPRHQEELRSQDDEDKRGLVFISLQTNLAGQFEFVQREWLNDGDIFGQGRDRDPIAGGEPGRIVIPGLNPPVLGDLPAFVRVLGGAYFLKPSVSTFRQIVDYARSPG